MFANQVAGLQAAGVARICTYAEGQPGDPEFNGYYTWPRLGYDGKIPDRAWVRIPEALRSRMGDSRSVLDLFSLPGGKEAWKQYGCAIKVSFDLTPGSRSMRTLEAYQREREQRRGGTAA
jgi:hypothetical protein